MEEIMKLSARNVIKGKVKSIAQGMVNTEITIDIGNGQELVSIITKSSADSLDLRDGNEVYAVIKASNVMVATD